MLKIISSPPFDDYSKKLFFQVFGKKKELGLSDASFVYIWTGALSTETTFSYSNNNLASSSPLQLPMFSDFVMSHSIMIAGKKRFFNTRDDMYSLYCDYAGITAPRDLFDTYYSQYAENVMDRSMMEDLIEKACINDIVVLFIKDHFRISTVSSWTTMIPELSIYFNNLCDYYPNKRFILVTSLENLHKEIVKDNCTIIPMGGDITNQLSMYMQYVPNVEKNPAAKNFISLNRGQRHHRTYLVSALYGRELHNYGMISHLSFPEVDSLSDAIQYNHLTDRQYELSNIGFKRFIRTEESSDIYAIHNDNLTNFKQNLLPKYNNSLIELVSETSYNEHSFNITEKTLHFIYGGNFPVLLSSPGTVNFLRNMGIDMFDDVVNHSYDTIEDPALRINTAIESNLSILISPNMIERWKENKYRIDKNIAFVKEGKLIDFYTDRFWNTLKGL